VHGAVHGSSEPTAFSLEIEVTMDGLIQDLRYSVRMLARSPGLLVTAAVSLAIGVAANTTIFSAVDVFLYQPLPYPEPDRLVRAFQTNQERGWTGVSPSIPDYLDWRERSRTMELGAFYGTSLSLSGGEQPERVRAVRVSRNFFDVIGIAPAHGRSFRPDEEQAGADNAIVISHGLWQRRYAGDGGIVGRTVVVDGVPKAIIGVMSEEFDFPSRGVDIWAPLGQTGQEPRDSRYLAVFGRIRQNASLDATQAELSSIAAQLEATYPLQNKGIGARIILLKREMFDETFWTAAMICTVAVAFVLLIACANIANLLLARASSRDREISVRTVLGAGRWKIVRQLMTESLVLALAGGVLGLLLSVWGIRWLVSIMPPDFFFVERIGIDGRVLVFTLAITILSGFLFGLAPALQAARPDLSQSLREAGGRGSSVGGRRGRFRSGLVVAEIGLALSLLIAAGLLIRSYIGLQSEELGFDHENVLTANLSLLEQRYPDSVQAATFFSQLESRLSQVSGFEAVGSATNLPMSDGSGTSYAIEGEPPVDPAQRPVATFRGITPGFVRALGIPLVRGRAFTDQDRTGTLPVLIVNEVFAAKHWPNGDAIGKRVIFSSGPREIVGVVANTRDDGPDDDAPPVVYLPSLQRGYREMTIAIKTEMDPATAVARLRSEVAALDPELPLFSIASYTQIIEQWNGGDRVMVKLLSVFGAFALVLAIIGVYGVVAYSVTQRTPELGIRMALGAQRQDILRMIVRQGALLASLGIFIGLGVALSTTRFLAAFLTNVSPFDLTTFVVVTLVLGGAAVVAAVVPARRATRIHPVDALRYE
jgi:putative ABC transport system permease protein